MMKRIVLISTFLVSQAAFGQMFVGEDEELQDAVESSSELMREAPLDSVMREPIRDHRTPRADLVVKAINIQNVITEDVTNSQAQYVSILVQNIGNQKVQGTSNVVQMNGPHYSASVYGPAPGIPNSYNLGAAIQPGQQGLISFYLPLGTLRHCQRVSGVIDTTHVLQKGPIEVFYNDSLAVTQVIDKKSIRICAPDRVER